MNASPGTRPEICPACGGQARPLFTASDRNQGLSDGRFLYRRCASCRLVYLRPVPADLGRHYGQAYPAYRRGGSDLATRAASERYKLDLVLAHAAPGRLLEIGPASGNFAFLAKQAGFTVEAIEMDAECCRHLAEDVGVTAHHSADPARTLAGLGTFRVIALWHVIEHLADPWSLLPILADHLAPGGLLVIAAPNPESRQFACLGRFWVHTDAPRHLQLIPARLLERLLVEAGLEPVARTSADPGARFLDRMGWQASLEAFARPGWLRFLLKVVGRACLVAALPWERQAMRGSAYTLFLRRPLRAADAPP